MGTYGTFTGIVRYYDEAAGVGYMLVLKEGDVVSTISGDGWSSGATAYDEGVGWWFERQQTTLAIGGPMGLLLAITRATAETALGLPRVFIGDSDGNKLLWDGTQLIVRGTIYADDGEFTGTVNWGGGKGVLNTTGLAWTIDSDDYVKIDTSDPGPGPFYLKIVSNTSGTTPLLAWNKYDEDTTATSASAYAMYAYHTGSNGTAIYASGARRGVRAAAAPDAGTQAPSAGMLASGGTYAVAGAGIASNTTHAGHFELYFLGANSAILDIYAGYIGNLYVAGSNTRESAGNFIQFSGKSDASGPLTKNLVKESDVSTATRAGWVRVRLDDSASRITTQSYFIPVYTLA